MLTTRLFFAWANSIIFRAFQGIGGSGDFALCSVIVLDLVPSHKYAEYSSNISIVYAISLCVGPIIGGAITQDSTWRWIFLLKSVPRLYALDNYQRLTVILICQCTPCRPDCPRAGFRHAQRISISPQTRPGQAQLSRHLLQEVYSTSGFSRYSSAFDHLHFLRRCSRARWGGLPVEVCFRTCFDLNLFSLYFYLKRMNSLTGNGLLFPQVITLLVIAGLCGIAFVFWERHITLSPHATQEPVFPWRFAQSRVFMGVLL